MKFVLAIVGLMLFGSVFASPVKKRMEAPRQIVWVRSPLLHYWNIWTMTGVIEQIPDKTRIEIIEQMSTYPAAHIRYKITGDNGEVSMHDQVVLSFSIAGNTTTEPPKEFK